MGASYSTPDSVEDVKEYYRRTIPHCIVTRKGIEYSEDGYQRLILVHRHRGETHILVASHGEPAAN